MAALPGPRSRQDEREVNEEWFGVFAGLVNLHQTR
jgi:hypothetical protein